MVQLRELFQAARWRSDRHQNILFKPETLIVILTVALFLVACDRGAAGDANGLTDSGDSAAVDGAEAGPNKTTDNESGASQSTESDSAEAESDDSPSPGLTATPAVAKQIVLCLGSSPTSLFPYGDESIVAIGLRHAIYENLFTTLGYDYQVQGLEKLPSIEDGDATKVTVTVMEGDKVQDIHGSIVSLVSGVTVLNSNGEPVQFDGTPIEMLQMIVDFNLQAMYWSDGTPVTARDSVFSYQVASDPQIIVGKDRIATTESYEATGASSVRWTGIPGYIDQTYFLNVWPPLPSHQLGGMSASELKSSELTNKMPLSSGPYVVAEWASEGELILTRNEHYYRQGEGFPVIDRIIVHFGGGEEFLAGDPQGSCDIIANGAISNSNLPLLDAAAEAAQWQMLNTPGSVFEHIAFGINPILEYADRRPDWFEDTRVRQAMTLCTDRQRMIDELTDGRAELLHAYVSENHRLFPDDLQKWPYDPDQANRILDEAGYLDFSEDGRRQDVSSGIPMTITIGTNSESSLRLHITEIFKENMADCGIPVETYDFPAGTWYAEGPIGRLFGRRFDLAQFAWIAKALPDCGLYLSENVPGPLEAGFGGWQNTNVTGWSNDDFDNACRSALDALSGGPGYDDYQKEALRIFARELPVIPLFTNTKIAAIRPWMSNIRLDPSQPSLLWNIHEWDIER